MSGNSSSSWTPSRVTEAGGLGRGSNPLDSFFPFDPYLLRRSHAYVDTIYNTWKVELLSPSAYVALDCFEPSCSFAGDAGAGEYWLWGLAARTDRCIFGI